MPALYHKSSASRVVTRPVIVHIRYLDVILVCVRHFYQSRGISVRRKMTQQHDHVGLAALADRRRKFRGFPGIVAGPSRKTHAVVIAVNNQTIIAVIRIHRPTRRQGSVRVADAQEQPLAPLGKRILVDLDVQTSRPRILVDDERADAIILGVIGIERVVAARRIYFLVACKACTITRNLQNGILGHRCRKQCGVYGVRGGTLIIGGIVGYVGTQRTNRHPGSPFLSCAGLVQSSDFAYLRNPDLAVTVHNRNRVCIVVTKQQTGRQGIRAVALGQTECNRLA